MIIFFLAKFSIMDRDQYFFFVVQPSNVVHDDDCQPGTRTFCLGNNDEEELQ